MENDYDEDTPRVVEPRVYHKPRLRKYPWNLTMKPIPQLGKWDKKYGCWRQTDAERKRADIKKDQKYLVVDNGTILIGQFWMNWYGWSFHPDYGVMSMQIEHLNSIYLIENYPKGRKRWKSKSE